MRPIHAVTIAPEITERADQISREHATYLARTDFNYRSLIRDCEKLKEANAFEGWVAHGLCELLVGDEQAFRRCFENARRLAGSRVDECDSMFAQGLLRMGSFGEALTILRDVALPEKGRFGMRSSILEHACAFHTLAEYRNKAENMGLRIQSEVDFELVAKITAVLGEEGISDDEVASYLEQASRPIAKRRLIQQGYSIGLLPTEGLSVVLVTVNVTTDGPTLADMTYELASALAEFPSVRSNFHVSYGVTPDADQR